MTDAAERLPRTKEGRQLLGVLCPSHHDEQTACSWVAPIFAIEAEAAAAERERWFTYAVHLVTCECFMDRDGDCDCGLDNLILDAPAEADHD